MMVRRTARALDARQPLLSVGGELLHVSDGVTFTEADDGSGSVFLWGRAAWTWAAGDRVARRLAAVQLVEARAAPQRRVAAAFGVNEDTLILWRGHYGAGGLAGLVGRRPGPKGPSKLTDEKRVEISALRAQGLTLNSIAERAGVSTDTVRRALSRGSQLAPPDEPVDARIPPPPSPSAAAVEHETAQSGSITAPHPVVGQSVPKAGTLLILPALAATGLLDAAARVYSTGPIAVEGLHTLVLSLVYGCLLDERRVAGSIHQQLHELAALGRADQLIDELARRHVAAHSDVDGIFYLDGHVRAYRRSREVAGADLARIRLSTGDDDYVRTLDRDGDGVLRWTTPADPSLIGHLRAVTTKARDLAGPAAHPTICFDHGGWPPKLLAELVATRFDVVTYGKGGAHDAPLSSFRWHSFTDGSGRVHRHLLADRVAHLRYDGGRRRFKWRQVIGLEPRTGLQSEILTTSRGDPEPATIARAMLCGSTHKRFIDSCASLDDAGPDAGCPPGELERIQAAVRMATYNAESGLARLLLPGHARSSDDARGLIREALRTPADVEIIGDELRVHLHAASTARASQAISSLCDDLTTTKTVLPGSDLALVYTMEHDEVE